MYITQRLLISMIERKAHRRSLNGLKDLFPSALGAFTGFLESEEDYEMLAQLNDSADKRYFFFLKGTINPKGPISSDILQFPISDKYSESVWKVLLCKKLQFSEDEIREAIAACA